MGPPSCVPTPRCTFSSVFGLERPAVAGMRAVHPTTCGGVRSTRPVGPCRQPGDRAHPGRCDGLPDRPGVRGRDAANCAEPRPPGENVVERRVRAPPSGRPPPPRRNGRCDRVRRRHAAVAAMPNPPRRPTLPAARTRHRLRARGIGLRIVEQLHRAGEAVTVLEEYADRTQLEVVTGWGVTTVASFGTFGRNARCSRHPRGPGGRLRRRRRAEEPRDRPGGKGNAARRAGRHAAGQSGDRPRDGATATVRAPCWTSRAWPRRPSSRPA